MRRLSLLLLLLVLPLQMSWAAMHFCDDAGQVKEAVEEAAIDHAHDSHAAEPDSGDEQSAKIVDACCGAADGCHGLHHLIGCMDAAFAPAGSGQVPIESGAAPPSGGGLSRVERPKWSAA